MFTLIAISVTACEIHEYILSVNCFNVSPTPFFSSACVTKMEHSSLQQVR